MLERVVLRRLLVVGGSTLLHLGLLTALLFMQRWVGSASATRLVLPIELVIPDEPEVRRQTDAPKPSTSPTVPRPVRPLRILDAPSPQIEEPRPEAIAPLTEPERPAADPPPSTPVAADTAPIPPAPPTAPPVVSATASLAPAAPSVVSATASAPAAAPSVDARPTERSAMPAVPSTGGHAPGGAADAPQRRSAVARATPPDLAPTPRAAAADGITQHAKPQGGYQVRPTYPSSARRLGAQGTTLLKVHVLMDGHVGEVVVEESAGHPDLDQAAASAVRRWRFDPARRGNDPVDMWVLLPFEFRLK